MIHIITLCFDDNYVKKIQDLLKECYKEIDTVEISFKYYMDALDYLNTAKPEKVALFFLTNDVDEALEVSSRVNKINPHYRINVICEQCAEIEKMYYNGITYFIKIPFGSENLIRCAEFVKSYYNEQAGKTLVLKNKIGEITFNYCDIKYIMSDKRKIIVFYEKEELTFYYKLDDVEQMLEKGFLRCHQSFLVNINKIKSFVEDGLLLNDGEFIPVSRKKYYSVRKEFLSYVTGSKIE